MHTETYQCQQCGIDVVRPIVRGQRPKWCNDCRKNIRTNRPCAQCGKPVARGAQYCSTRCVGQSRAKAEQLTISFPVDQRSKLRRAIEEGKAADVIAALQQLSKVDDATGCWVWQRRVQKGYPVAVIGRRGMAAHRIALEAKLGAALGSQAAHHACANPICVNPDHLQAVTHRENVAEMLARRALVARVRELEEALAAASPNHPLLRQVAAS